MQIPYELLGKVFVYAFVFSFVVLLFAMIIGIYSFKKRKILFPNFVLFVLYLFYSPAKWICKVLHIRDTLVDEILIEVRNAVMRTDFIHNKDRRIILLPQCLRNSDCRARCDPIFGYECKLCGKCDIGTICKAAQSKGFTVFVIPGGSFVKKIMTEYKPASCIGVACYTELSESMQEASFIPLQGVCLLKDGCFETEVNVDEVIEVMEMCDV